MTLWHVKPPWHFCLFDNAGMWGAYKEKEGREKGRTGAGAVKRPGEGEVGDGMGLWSLEGLLSSRSH